MNLIRREISRNYLGNNIKKFEDNIKHTVLCAQHRKEEKSNIMIYLKY